MTLHPLPPVIRGYELPALLTQLMKKKASGRLTLTVGETERTIQLMLGVISSVASKNPTEHLVARFPRKKLSKQQHAAVQELMHKESLRFGAALVKLKLVDAQMFSTLLAQHHAFLLGRCLRAKAIRWQLDAQAKGPADRAPLKFLEAIEHALPRWRRSSVERHWVLTAQKEDMALAQRLDPSPIQQRILAVMGPDGLGAEALAAQAGGREAKRALQALVMCGLLKPTEASLAQRRTRAWAYATAAGIGFAAGVAATLALTHSTPPPARAAVEPLAQAAEPQADATHTLPASAPAADTGKAASRVEQESNKKKKKK